MYCFEANKCHKADCPVKLKHMPHCWEYFENNPNVEINGCKASSCKKCNYKLGWEIGLISDELFNESDTLSVDQYLPDSQEKKQDSNKANSTAEDYENISKGKRFCYEIMNCHNEQCVIRKQSIFRCFKYFQENNKDEKSKITCCDRACETCFYKSGWDLGLISENNFEDILNKEKSKLHTYNKTQQDLIVSIYMAELAKKPLSRDEELELAKKIAGDKRASELLLLANLKLVTQIANKYSSKLPLMDLIQEGNIGLIKAISKFDYRLGYKFSTYAAYWIKYYMQKAVAEQQNAISIPCHLIAIANKIKLHIKKFQQTLLRPPTLQELSELLNLAEDKIVNVLNVTRTPISIYSKVSNDGDDNETIEYYLEDQKTLTPEEAYFEKQKKEAITLALNKLNERQKEIIEKFYGLGQEEVSLAEIGRQQNISRERVRQILQQGLLKLQQEKSIIDLK